MEKNRVCPTSLYVMLCYIVFRYVISHYSMLNFKVFVLCFLSETLVELGVLVQKRS